jgi:hypothetical protein
MSTRWQLCLAVLGAMGTLACGGRAALAADARAMIAVQQKLRADLLAAMADGELDGRERRRLEQDAAEKLRPEALDAFRDVLDRMQRSAAPASTSGKSGETSDQKERARRPHRAERALGAERPHRAQRPLGGERTGTAEPVVIMEQTASVVEGPEFPYLEPAAETADPEIDTLVQATFGEPAGEVHTATYPRDPMASLEAPDSPLVHSTSALADRVLDDPPLHEEPGEVVYEEVMGCGGACVPSGMGCLDWIQFSGTVEAFQGPMDLDGANANYGVRFAVNGAMPISQAFGIGAQAGTSGVIADYYGTEFTGSRERTQNFTTVGVFQRLCVGERALKYGLAFDWLFDEYYASFTMSQWRVKLAYEVSPVAEIGLWSAIPNAGDHALLGFGRQVPTLNAFKPFAQGSLYWQQCWANGATTTTYAGIADEPGAWVFGGDARIPMGPRLAFVGNVHYIAPSAEGIPAQEEEVWNISVGLEWTPGACANRCRVGQFRPLFRLADNGLFAVRRY